MFVIGKSSKARCFKHVQNISPVKLSYNLKWGYEDIKQLIRFLSIQKEEKSVVVVRLQELVPDFLIQYHAVHKEHHIFKFPAK